MQVWRKIVATLSRIVAVPHFLPLRGLLLKAGRASDELDEVKRVGDKHLSSHRKRVTPRDITHTQTPRESPLPSTPIHPIRPINSSIKINTGVDLCAIAPPAVNLSSSLAREFLTLIMLRKKILTPNSKND